MIVKKINVDNKINACYIIIPIYLFSRTEYHFFEHCLVTSIKEYFENKAIISGVTKKDNVIIRILFSKVMEEKCFDYLSEDNEEIFKK